MAGLGYAVYLVSASGQGARLIGSKLVVVGSTYARAVNVQSLQPEIALRNYQNTPYRTAMENASGGKMVNV